MKSKLTVAVALFAATLMIQSPAWAALAFAPPQAYQVGVLPNSVAIGDFNGDGDPDLATTNASDNSVSVLLGNGDGTFAATTNYPVGVAPQSVAIGDLNGDGNADLTTANTFGDTVSVLLGNGDGTFAPQTTFFPGSNPTSVAIGDLSGDGNPDLTVTNPLNNAVSVLLGNGDGTFGPPTSFPVAVGPAALAIGDLNGDGEPDLTTANNSDDVSVLLNNGNGTFTAPTSFPVGDGSVWVAIGDLNGDGKPDLTTANQVSNNVSVLLGNGNGTFTAQTTFATGVGPAALAIGDLNGDGKPDLTTANHTTDTVSVLLGNGDGTFAAQTSFPVGDGPIALAISDLNGDGKPDLTTADHFANTASVLLNLSVSPFATGPTASISGTAVQGQTLTAHEGSPDPTPDSIAYQWHSDGADIVGATAETLKLKAAQVGKKISVTVTVSADGYDDASDTSDETAVVKGIFKPGPTASISGEPRVGKVLTAHAGSPSPTPTSKKYKWYADGHLISGTAKTLTVTSAHLGKRIQVRVTVDKAGYVAASDLSDPTFAVSNLPAKTISMELNDYTVARGQTVHAEIELLAPNEPWSIVLDGKKLASGVANTSGIAVTTFVVPANATIGIRTLHAYGLFNDRTDPDRITVR